MSNKKICVYAICKNEIKFADRWLSSLAPEADYVVVLDTGSTDGTYEYLQSDPRVYKTHQVTIDPFRFDTARNKSMKLIPEDTDICVVSDFDQIFRPGWGEELRKLYDEGYDEVYGPIIDYDDNNNEIKQFLSKNVHPNRKEWYWERPIHEGILYHGSDEIKIFTSDSFVIEHHPDTQKSRAWYLSLLEKEYAENASDPMCAIYYGCELAFHERFEESLNVFLRANKECDYKNNPVVGSQIQLNIADCYITISRDFETALSYALDAEKYGIFSRYLYMTQANIYSNLGKYEESKECILKALSITTNRNDWIEDEKYFEGACEDELSLVYDKLGEYKLAIAYCSLALYYHPDDERLKNNLQYFILREESIIHGQEEENDQ